MKYYPLYILPIEEFITDLRSLRAVVVIIRKRHGNIFLSSRGVRVRGLDLLNRLKAEAGVGNKILVVDGVKVFWVPVK